MHVYSIRLFNKQKNIQLAKAEDFTPMSWATRISGSATEAMQFISRTLMEKSKTQTFICCEESDYLAWVYNRNDNLTSVLITSQNYPKRFAMDLMQQSMATYESVKWDWQLYEKEINQSEYQPIKELMLKYHNPKDGIITCQKQLNDTKIKLYKSVDLLLERGEKIEDLAQKSQDLSARSKQFAHKAKKLNRCCVIM